MTRDFINPEMAWPQIAALRSVTKEAGFELRERLAAYPEYLARAELDRRNRCAGRRWLGQMMRGWWHEPAEAILDKALEGRELSVEDGAALFDAEGETSRD